MNPENEFEFYYIWSHEHQGWWGYNRMGYVTDIRKAGIYSYEEACDIVLQGNKYRGPTEPPYEAMVPMTCAVGMEHPELI
jgi:hypothetical protein